MEHVDVIVIGGGIAGVSLASALALSGRVAVVEAGSSLFAGSTGNSAATFVATYDDAVVRACTLFGRSVFESAQEEWSSPPLRPLPLLRVAAEGEEGLLGDWYARVAADVPSAELIGPAEMRRICPLLRPGFGTSALYEPEASEIDVAAVCQTYRRRLLQRGGVVATGFAVTAVSRAAGKVIVTASDGRQISAARLVLAAGAAAGRLGHLAGALEVSMTITRRSLFLLRPGEGAVIPRVVVARAVPGRFYFKPEGGALLCSPADEEPVTDACSVPDEYEVARALDEIESATVLDSRRVVRVWSATRSHVADRLPVIGFDPLAPDVFWFTGFSGFGIQSNPGFLHLALQAWRGEPLGFAEDLGADLSPGRLARP